MRRRLVVLSLVLVLLAAALCGCSFGAEVGEAGTVVPEASLSVGGAVGALQLKDVVADKTFYVTGSVLTAENAADYVSVIDNIGNAVAVSVVPNADYGFAVYAPQGGYTAGMAYRIALSDGVVFAGEAASVRSIDFIIKKAEIYDVEFQDGVVVLSAGTFSQVGDTLLTTEGGITEGNYLIVPTTANAFNAYYVADVAYNGGEYLYTLADPDDLADVFGDIDIYEKFDLADGTVTINEEALAGVDDMFPALAEIGTNFSVDITRKDIDLAANKAYIDFKIKFTIEGVNFEILIANDIDIQPEVNYSTIPFSVYVGADMAITTHTTFSVNTGYSVSGSRDMEVITAELAKLDGLEFSQSLAKLFKWEVAYGPISLAYDLDLMFNVNILGELNAYTTTTSAYSLGAYYISDNGDEPSFKAFAEKKEECVTTLDEVELYGKLGVSVGLKNALTLKLVQVASVGLELELGFYLDMYGCVKINVVDIDETTAGIYGDFGFYYDVNLVLALGIPQFKLGLDKTIDLANDKISIFDFGSREFVVDYTSDVNELVVTGNQAILPALSVKVYDLVARTYTVQPLAITDSAFTLPSVPFFTVDEQGILTIAANAPTSFGYAEDDYIQEIIYTLNDNDRLTHSIFVKYRNNLPYAEDAIREFTKDNPADVVFTLQALGHSIKGVSVSTGTRYNLSGNLLTFAKADLVVLPNQTIDVRVVTDVNVIDMWISMSGRMSIVSAGSGTAADPYLIYNAEQVLEMFSSSASYNYFTNKYLKLMSSIDLNGAQLAPISEFCGHLNGNGFSLRNFSIVSAFDGYTAPIAKNRGTISGLSVEVNIANTERVSRVAGLVGINTGVIDGCTVRGTLSAEYETSPTKHADIRVGGIVAMNDTNGVVSNSYVYSVINAKTSGSSVSSTAYAAGIVAYNRGTVTGNSMYGELNVDVKGWHTEYSDKISNNF